MKVLVTGGTGFVGREVLRQLHRSGHAVRVLIRNRQSAAARAQVARWPVELWQGDLLGDAALAEACDGCDAVIHLVGIISEVGAQTFENVHTRVTRNILAAARQACVRRFVHMSALGTRPNAASRYHQTKWAAEEAVRDSGLDWTIFRPSLIYGPEDHFVNLFARMARVSPVLPVIGAGKARLQPVAVEDVATCFVGALSEPRSVGRTFDVCGTEHVTLPEILRTILRATRRRRFLLPVPQPVARLQAAFLEWCFPTLLHRAPPLNRDQLIMLEEGNTGNPSAAMELFGFSPAPLEVGLARWLGLDAQAGK